jgi:hypothetical protein
MITSKASWAAQARADKWWQAPEPQSVISLVEELVDNSIDPSSAARQACALYSPLIAQNPASADITVAEVWGIVFRAVRAIGRDEGASTRLRDFIFAFHDFLDQDGEQVKDNESVLWRDLPGFSLMFREYCISKSKVIINYSW